MSNPDCAHRQEPNGAANPCDVKSRPSIFRLNIHVPLSVRMALDTLAHNEGETLQSVTLRILKDAVKEHSK